MLNLSFCPKGDIENTIGFTMTDPSQNPIYPNNLRVYFYTPSDYPSVIFCDNPDGNRSEDFFPTNDYSNHWTLTFNLAAGADVREDVDWLMMKVEWGPTFQDSQFFPHMEEASPDLNGDLVINLADAQVFSAIFLGTYDVRADFNHDGVVNLADASVFQAHNSHSCP
jgi:hypothetical protein